MLKQTIILIGGAVLFIGCHMEDPNRGSPGSVLPTPESEQSASTSVCSGVPAAGFWKRQCPKNHPSEEHNYLQDYVALVSATAPFTDVTTVELLCEQLYPEPETDKCLQADAQFMTLLLNRASGRLDDACCVTASDGTTTTVSDMIVAIETLLGDETSRTEADCDQAHTLMSGINGGTTLCAAPEEPDAGPEEPAPDAGPEEPAPDAGPEEPAPDAGPEEPTP
jgi:hypothetical protein